MKLHKFRDLVFGLLVCSKITFLFLPFLGQRSGNIIEEVSLLSLTGIESYVNFQCVIIVIGILTCQL